MKILAIGDVHGRMDWMKYGDISSLINGTSQTPAYDKYVFLGDYVDSYELNNAHILSTLKKLVDFKDKFPDNVVLLLGNHDVQYLMPITHKRSRCSGFNVVLYYDLYDVFTRVSSYFHVVYQVNNYLFSHGGIHDAWLNNVLKYDESSGLTISDAVNDAFSCNDDSIYYCGYKRGGFNIVGGPLWCDKSEIKKAPVKGYHHVVGHSKVDGITKVLPYNGDANTSVTFCDCMEVCDAFVEIDV